MEATQAAKPRKTTDAFDAVCKKCGITVYTTEVIGELQSDGTYSHRREVHGSFRQACDAEGNVSGPEIPFCPQCTEGG